MSLEQRIASVARTLFLPEFSFAAYKFRVKEGESELADHVVWVDDLLIAFQMKERKPDLPEGQWFRKKVLGVPDQFFLYQFCFRAARVILVVKQHEYAQTFGGKQSDHSEGLPWPVRPCRGSRFSPLRSSYPFQNVIIRPPTVIKAPPM
jgi:hypothetical protein